MSRLEVPFKKITIEWGDAWSLAGWKRVEDVSKTLQFCETTGYLLHEDAEVWVVAASVSLCDDGKWDCNAVMCVPKKWGKEV